MLRAVKQVVWDWNGTLMDDVWLVVEVMNGILDQHRMPRITVETYRECFTFPVILYYQRLGFPTDEVLFREISRQFIAEYDRRRYECQLHKGVTDVLGELRSKGFQQVILSAYPHKTLVEIIGHFGLESYFDKLIGDQDIYARNKIANGIEHMKSLPLEPSEVLLVGDTLHDAEVAEAMGIGCLLIPQGYQSARQLQSAGHPILNTLGDLPQALGCSA